IILLPFSAIEPNSNFDIVNTSGFAGSSIMLRFKNIHSDHELLQFKGIVTGAQYELGENFTRNIIIKCSDPTIKLESLPRYNVFNKINIKSIVENVLRLNGVSCPNNVSDGIVSKKFEYYCQYNETDYNFLNRLSEYCLAPFFYDGVKLYF